LAALAFLARDAILLAPLEELRQQALRSLIALFADAAPSIPVVGDTVAPRAPAPRTIAIEVAGRCYGRIELAEQHPGLTSADERFLEVLAQILAFACHQEALAASAGLSEQQLHEATAVVREREAALARAQQVAHLGDWSFNVRTGRIRWSKELFRILGLQPADGIPPGIHPERAFVHPDDLAAYEATMRRAAAERAPRGLDHRVIRRDGEVRWVHLETSIERDGSGRLERLFGTVHDITEQKAAERKLAMQASTDVLTDLPNRTQLEKQLQAAVESGRRAGTKTAVVFLDVDRFKTINDTLGHAVGDALLISIAARLHANTRGGDFVARMGGDEFIVILNQIESREDVANAAHHLADALSRPMMVGGREIVITISAGISVFPDDGLDAETLIRNADTAMVEAKDRGPNQIRFFTRSMHEAAVVRLAIENALYKALERDEFALYYQPIVAFDGRLAGCEALLRWRRSDGAIALPDSFISIAEDCGVIVPIGTWVLRTACAQSALWNAGPQRLVVSVNVSVVQITQPTFVAGVRAALSEASLAPELLEIELTESTLWTDTAHMSAVLEELRRSGVRVAIDDFGTGYNTLTSLRSFPVDTIKIDRSFITEIATSRGDRAIASAIISAAHGLGTRVVAEGIETTAQLATLDLLGCDEAQGFLFSRPLPVEHFSASLRGAQEPWLRRTAHIGGATPSFPTVTDAAE
jgi:diguanylate cyclase